MKKFVVEDGFVKVRTKRDIVTEQMFYVKKFISIVILYPIELPGAIRYNIYRIPQGAMC
jgi:hypothetical protein